MKKTNPSCQICGQGELKSKKKYRMSGPVVAIGYILLIPSILGMLFGLLMIFATGSAVSETSTGIKQEVREQLMAADIPGEISEKVITRQALTEEENAMLTEEQSRALADAELTYSASQVGVGAGTAIAGGFSAFMVISSFVGGLIGWLLIMKKKVLQCTSCNAIVAAS